MVMTKPTTKLCVICGQPIDVQSHGWTDGHNAMPVANGRCCTHCNSLVVIPARIAELTRRMKEEPDAR